MKTRYLLLAFVCGGLTLTTARADQSQFKNAKVETGQVGQALQNIVTQIAAESSKPVWIAYEIPVISRFQSICCGNFHQEGQEDYCGTCNLEQEHNGSTVLDKSSKTVLLEQDPQVLVLLRIDQKRVMRIRLASSNCTLDAGGLRIVWLPQVKPEDSVSFLSQFAKAGDHKDEGDGLANQAIMAIAQHGDPSADRLFVTYVSADQPEWLRDKVSFWLGAARGKSGLALLEKMAKNDPSTDIRAKVAFGLFVSNEPQAIDDLIRIAKDDPEAHVRSQALFWLAQKAGQKASATITGAIQDDPDTEVKKKAVFALSQMPKEEGVPKLIQVAQTNKNPEVRKQAMFWLGQSQDPRAVAFFETILSQ